MAEMRAPESSSTRDDVGPRVGRQLVEGAGLGDVLPPAGEVLVDRHGVVEVGLVDRHLVVAYAVDVVGHADRHLLEPGEHVELGEHEVGDAVDPSGVAGDHGVVPAAAARPAGRGAVLRADLAQVLTGVVVQLGRERPLADAGRVGLHDPDHPVEPGRRDARAGAGAAGGRRGRRHERVGAVVDVEQRGLAGLEQHRLAAVERLVEQQPAVHDVRRQPVGVRRELLDDRPPPTDARRL